MIDNSMVKTMIIVGRCMDIATVPASSYLFTLLWTKPVPIVNPLLYGMGCWECTRTPVGDVIMGNTPAGDAIMGSTPAGDVILGSTPIGDCDIGKYSNRERAIGEYSCTEHAIKKYSCREHDIGKYGTLIGIVTLGGASGHASSFPTSTTRKNKSIL